MSSFNIFAIPKQSFDADISPSFGSRFSQREYRKFRFKTSKIPSNVITVPLKTNSEFVKCGQKKRRGTVGPSISIAQIASTAFTQLCKGIY